MAHDDDGAGLIRTSAARPRGVAPVRHGQLFVRAAAAPAMVGRKRSRTDPTAGRFTRPHVVEMVSDAFDRFHRHVPALPIEPTWGSRQNVMLAALTLSLLEVLEEMGVEREYTISSSGTPAGGSIATGGGLSRWSPA